MQDRHPTLTPTPTPDPPPPYPEALNTSPKTPAPVRNWVSMSKVNWKQEAVQDTVSVTSPPRTWPANQLSFPENAFVSGVKKYPMNIGLNALSTSGIVFVLSTHLAL